MDAPNSPYSRSLLILMAALYLLSISAFGIANWVNSPEATPWWEMLLNLLILSIPLVLLYGSVYVLATAWRERSRQGQVSPRLGKIIHWTPRIAAIVIILFTSLFSLDVFEAQAPPLELLLGFLVHNIPSIVMILLLVFAWRRPVVGFVAFVIVAALFLIRSIFTLPNLLLFALPILMIALLFYADWKWVKMPKT
jgi:hypothetical protein